MFLQWVGSVGRDHCRSSRKCLRSTIHSGSESERLWETFTVFRAKCWQVVSAGTCRKSSRGDWGILPSFGTWGSDCAQTQNLGSYRGKCYTLYSVCSQRKVLFSRESQCFPRRSREKHWDSRENKLPTGCPQKTDWTLFDFMWRKSYKSYRHEIKIIAFRKD